MQTSQHALLSPALGTQRTLTSLHFGQSGRGPKAYIQASLHADELPGMLVAHHLRALLETAEAQNALLGEVILVPLANPIGLNQTTMHYQLGRFEVASMENFNRNYPDFFTLLKDQLGEQLGDDAEANKRVIRLAMLQFLQAEQPATELHSMRNTLMRLAHDADLVLDLHCDFEAALHLYVEQPMLDQMMPLAAYLGAQAVLWANGSGGSISFDEALSGPWWRLKAHFADHAPVPLACASTTVELRGQLDVSPELAAQDAQAIFHYLQHQGIVAGTPPAPPEPLCEATPLAGTESLHAPHPGVIAFAAKPGDHVRAGQTLAHVIDPLSNRSTPVVASTDGVIYARHSLRWATANLELCRIAGHTPIRAGNLLSP
ncbi:succinylglutamate desuccinylase/aspartoacylase family protein [Hydrogenophaga sp. PAMC20947]|uniref:succinylglutamate desuccinylase/aspartoacylase family protein n=1 Tax=Hydrogenophaga sp. PAMC20947 TaxID=2565558 RepID=UPI00109E32F9|nr:succinylglutamate desuccinylase/aspartoacylase family protein [Hydrogenophaga sp. PAMC20947]QCB45543.1 succinylglutamate desuccinylase/aspartoacylase family protein [Hydrogenophaga sp. PAMC20947]